MLELVAFAVAAGCLLGLSALMVVSLLAQGRRLWPAGAYCERAPRFVGVRTLTRALDDD